MSPTPTAAPPKAAPSRPVSAYFEALPGGALIWIVFLLEMGTFALFFLGFAWQSRANPALFAAGQARLHADAATLNTLILLSGSWLAARAVNASRERQPVSPWLLGTALSGLAFIGIKGCEYARIFAQGIRLSTDAFWFNYLFLTLLHNLHVAIGVWFMAYLALAYRQRAQQSHHHLEAAAIYWHLVDLIWVFLFPILHFARPW